ncbi:MAG: phage tail tape measure protein [Deltaproteobacteria bacterium]|nr:phage tail tape measure protein [Deltaproteobacteria bacterium]
MAETIKELRVEFTANTTSVMAGIKVVTKGLKAFASATAGRFLAVARAAVRMGKAIAKVALKIAAALIAAGTAAAAFSVKFSANFGKAMAEVSTLVNTAVVDMGKLTRGVRDLSLQFGGDQITEAVALYTALSSGADASGEALFVLEVANKAAVAGVTDVNTAMKAIIGTLNAYNFEMDEAENISDILFQTVKEGSVTLPILADTLGVVNASAALAGVSFEEISAAMATLTKGEIPAARAATGLRAAITAFIQPTDDAKEAAKELGINLSGSALKGKGGLAGAIASISKAIKGKSNAAELLTKLFGNVRAFTAIAPLAGTQAAEFARVLESVSNATNATNVAFEKMSKTASFRFSLVTARIKDMGLSIGEFLEPAVIAVADAIGSAIDAVTDFVSENSEAMTQFRDDWIVGFKSFEKQAGIAFQIAVAEFETFMHWYEMGIIKGKSRWKAFMDAMKETEAYKAIVKAWDAAIVKIKDMWNDAMTSMLVGVGNLAKRIELVWDITWAIVTAGMRVAWKSATEYVTNQILAMVGDIQSGFKLVIDHIVAELKKNPLIMAFLKVGQGIVGAGRTAINTAAAIGDASRSIPGLPAAGQFIGETAVGALGAANPFSLPALALETATADKNTTDTLSDARVKLDIIVTADEGLNAKVKRTERRGHSEPAGGESP